MNLITWKPCQNLGVLTDESFAHLVVSSNIDDITGCTLILVKGENILPSKILHKFKTQSHNPVTQLLFNSFVLIFLSLGNFWLAGQKRGRGGLINKGKHSKHSTYTYF